MKSARQTGYAVTSLIAIAMMASAGHFAMAADSAPVADWELSDTGMGSVNVMQGEGNAVTLAYPAQSSPPSPVMTDLLLGGSNPDNAFTGNLLEAGYSGIRLRVNGEGFEPDVLSLVIYQVDGSNIREWKYKGLEVSGTAGEWTINLIPLDVEKGWVTDFVSMKRSAADLWEADMSAVQAMFLRIAPSGEEAQSYSIADVQLTGPGVISEPAVLSPLEAYFGVSNMEELTPEMRAIDSDGDGMSDYHEILAGLNPYDATSVLTANVTMAVTGNTVSWTGVLGGTYGVMRSSNLLDEFTLISSGIKGTFTGQVLTYEDKTPAEGKPNFYKVVRY